MAKKTTDKKPSMVERLSNAAKAALAGTKKTTPSKAAPKKKAAAKKAAPQKAAAKKTTTTKPKVTKSPVKKATTTPAPKKKAAAKKAPAKTAATKEPAPKKAAANKAPAKKAAAKKVAPKKKAAPAKKAKPKAAASAPTPAPTTTAGNSKVTVTVRADIKPYRAAKDEEYMSKEQLQHFTLLLNMWKAELMHEVDRTVSHMKDEAANFPDPADRATQEEEFSLELRTRDRERKLIKKIEATLERIEQDDYGYCDSCGVEIGIQRLEARLTATQCIDCKTLDEIKEKQERG